MDYLFNRCIGGPRDLDLVEGEKAWPLLIF